MKVKRSDEKKKKMVFLNEMSQEDQGLVLELELKLGRHGRKAIQPLPSTLTM